MEEFLRNYGQYIICGLTCLISILVNLLKKRPVVDSIDRYIELLGLTTFPSLINAKLASLSHSRPVPSQLYNGAVP